MSLKLAAFRYGIIVNDETDNKGKIHDLIQTRYAW